MSNLRSLQSSSSLPTSKTRISGASVGKNTASAPPQRPTLLIDSSLREANATCRGMEHLCLVSRQSLINIVWKGGLCSSKHGAGEVGSELFANSDFDRFVTVRHQAPFPTSLREPETIGRQRSHVGEKVRADITCLLTVTMVCTFARDRFRLMDSPIRMKLICSLKRATDVVTQPCE